MVFEKLRFRRNDGEPIVLNRNYIHTPSGILKCLQCFLGLVSVLSILFGCRSSFDPYLGGYSGFVGGDWETALLLVHFHCLGATLVLLAVYYFSIIASTLIQKTIFEFVYNLLSCTLLLLTSVPFFIHLIGRNTNFPGLPFEPGFGAKITATMFGALNSVAYGMDTYYAYQSYHYQAE